LAELAAWCERFSPVVGLDPADEPDSLLMDVSGLAHLFGGEESLARTVVGAFQERGWEVRAAIADTVSAAWAVARYACAPPDEETGDLRYSIVPPRDPASLDGLPVEALRLPEAAIERLQRLGIHRLSQLQGLPRASLAARFGDSLLVRLDQLAGNVSEVIVAPRRLEPLAAQWSFEQATTHHGTIEWVLGELLARVARGLVERGHGAVRVECQLVGRNHRPVVLDLSLYQPSADPQHLVALAKLQLAVLTLSEAVEEIRVAAVATAPRKQRQRELFASSRRENPAQLAWLVERLSSRLGREQVVRAQLQAEAEIELVCRYMPLTGEPGRTAFPGRRDGLGRPSYKLPGPLLRPLRLFEPPRPIEVVGIALDGPPAMFHYQRRSYRVARCFGPERIETGWWRGASSRRDYYRVETDSGHRLWLFRRLQDRKWFVHGEFE
jgi:protein ImuB